MYDFTKRKFLNLPVQKQHKKCAELIRSIYDKQGQDTSKEMAMYHQMLEWMAEEPLTDVYAQQLADRYHVHLKKGNVRKKEHHLLSSIKKGDRPNAEDPWPIAIYLDRIRSAHNVGSILRTVEALSLGTVYFSEETPFQDHKQVQDTSMGASAWVPCMQGYALQDLMRPIIALETSTAAISLYEFVFPSSFTLVVGNEEYGCSEDTLKTADYLVEIPLRGRKNSLNVANAFAMAAGEIVRQKQLNFREVQDDKEK